MKNFKSVLVILLVISTLFVFTSCNNEDKTQYTEFNVETYKCDYAHVIFLCGQSNASGYTYSSCLKEKTTSELYSEYETGYGNVFINVMTENNYPTDKKFVETKIGLGCDSEHFGPELGFAKYLHDNYPRETFFIIKRTYGGSSLDSQWLNSETGERNTYYNEFKDLADSSLKYLTDNGINFKIEAFLWMQGETDSASGLASKYYDNLNRLTSYFRSDFSDYAATDGIYFIDAGISDFWIYDKDTNAEKVRFSESSSLNLYFSTMENGLTYNEEPEGNVDYCHFDSLSEIKLGELFAKAYESAVLK